MKMKKVMATVLSSSRVQHGGLRNSRNSSSDRQRGS